MNRDRGDRPEDLASDIRRQFGERPIMRYLHAMPAFKVAEEIPARFRALLDRIDRTEEKNRAKTPRR